MPVITSKWLGPSNRRGSRVTASAHSFVIGRKDRATVHWDYALGVEGNHDAAALKLAQKLGWDGTWDRHDSGDQGGFIYTRREAAHFVFLIEPKD